MTSTSTSTQRGDSGGSFVSDAQAQGVLSGDYSDCRASGGGGTTDAATTDAATDAG